MELNTFFAKFIIIRFYSRAGSSFLPDTCRFVILWSNLSHNWAPTATFFSCNYHLCNNSNFTNIALSLGMVGALSLLDFVRS